MKPSSTATPKNSVWKSVNITTFYNNVNELFNLHPVPKEIHHSIPKRFKKTENGTIPFEAERQLADDFAFIAACEYGVDFVTAATIEVLPDLSGLVLRLAANEGIADPVMRCLSVIIAALERCAEKSMLDPFGN